MATTLIVSQSPRLPWPQSGIASFEALALSSLSSKTAPSPIDETKPSPLLSLPPELRLRIYALALTRSSNHPPTCPSYAVTRNITGYIPTALLLVNRQVYTEARFLPFQSSTFEFYMYFESSLHCCRKWCQKLAGWQVREVRSVRLCVVERDLAAWASELGDVCGLLGAGLRELVIEVREDQVDAGLTVKRGGLDVSREARWVRDGVGRLRGLRRLVVRVPIPSCDMSEARGAVEMGKIGKEDRIEETNKENVLDTLKETLRATVPWCLDIVVACMEKRPPLSAARKMEQVFVW